MKVYLAHNFAAGPWLKSTIVPMIEAAGHTVNSRWIYEHEEHKRKDNQEFSAVVDVEDVEDCSTFIIFAENVGVRPGKGKYVELGYAIRAGKRVIVIGTDEDLGCVFYYLPSVRKASTIEEAIRMI